MIEGLLKGIANAYIKVSQLSVSFIESNPDIINVYVREIINNSCGLRIGSIIDYRPFRSEDYRRYFNTKDVIVTRRKGIVTKMTLATQTVDVSNGKTNAPKSIGIGILQLGVYDPYMKQQYIINIDEFNTYKDDIDFITDGSINILNYEFKCL